MTVESFLQSIAEVAKAAQALGVSNAILIAVVLFAVWMLKGNDAHAKEQDIAHDENTRQRELDMAERIRVLEDRHAKHILSHAKVAYKTIAENTTAINKLIATLEESEERSKEIMAAIIKHKDAIKNTTHTPGE